MPCAKCRDLHCRLDLATPGAPSRAIGVIDAGIRGGELAVVAGGPHPSANGPWPDSIEVLYACNACGQRFDLVAETYHGRGGSWRPR